MWWCCSLRLERLWLILGMSLRDGALAWLWLRLLAALYPLDFTLARKACSHGSLLSLRHRTSGRAALVFICW